MKEQTEYNCSRVVQLQAENIMRLKAVDLTPPEHLVQIVGNNEAGKSSLLRSIEIALAGAGAFPEMPVRKGQRAGVVEIDLGDLKVRRVINQAGHTSLVVRAKDGTVLETPQAILDRLRGDRTFDPMSFLRLKPDRKAEMLRQIAGLDWTAQDTKRKAAEAERTQINRDLRGLEATLARMPEADLALASQEETSTASVLSAQAGAAATNATNQQARNGARDAARDAERENAELARLTKELNLIQDKVNRSKQRLDAATEAADAAMKAVADLKDVDTSGFTKQLREVEAHNAAVRHARARKETIAKINAAADKVRELTRQMSAIDTAKAEAIQSAKYPVAGLGFTDSGEVAFGGLPFEQISTSEQLKVSVAIGLALNPKLRILLIRNGNDLDAGNMALLAQMAREANAQIWIERVVGAGEVAVIIEDGQAVNPVPAAAKEERSLL